MQRHGALAEAELNGAVFACALTTPVMISGVLFANAAVEERQYEECQEKGSGSHDWVS
jgi:hypothetical protein